MSKYQKNLSRGDIILSAKELLDAIAAEVVVCRKCDLWKSRKNAVPGEGDPESQVMFVGEAPGYWEDAKGIPFAGAAGKLFDTLLSDVHLSRKKVFISNILKCRPPKNRKPLSYEIKTCTTYLDRQIQAVQPKFIVTLGNCSTSYIFSEVSLPFDGITKARGNFHEVAILGIQARVFPTFHPAAALYSGEYRELLHRDFKLLKSNLTNYIFNI